MNYKTMINMIGGIGLILGHLNATASGFGGGWVMDKNTGTLSNPNHPPVASPQSPASRTMQAESDRNSYDGGWIIQQNTGS